MRVYLRLLVTASDDPLVKAPFGTLLQVWGPHIMDCPRGKWPRSPRIVMQYAPISIKWP